MAFALDPTEPIGDEVVRVARSQTAKLIRTLEQPERLGVEESVHDVRKRAKKLRALARLVRPALGDLYSHTNEAFRDAASQLSEARDSHVLVETLDHLTSSAAEGAGMPDVLVARTQLLAQEQQVHRSLDRDGERFESARQFAMRGAELVGSWSIDDDFDVLAGGLASTYRRLHSGFGRVQHKPTVSAFHEWRKRAKYHRYHLESLSEVYPPMMQPWIEEVRRLTDALGDDHDLAVLVATAREQPDLLGGTDEAEAVVALAETRGAVLRGTALSLGARLAVEEPEAVVDRLRRWWTAAVAYPEVLDTPR